MKLYCFCIIVLLHISIIVAGQQGSPFSLSLNYLPSKNESKPVLLNTNFSINLPAYRDTSITGLIGSSFKYYRFNFQNDSQNIHNLYSWSVPLTLLIKTSENRYLTLLIEPLLSSDFKDISTSDFRYNLAIFYVKKRSPNSFSGIGIAVSKRFSGFQIAPLWFVNMHFYKNWVLSGTIPFKSKIAYELDSKKQAGINFGANSNSFHLSEFDQNRYVDYQAIEASLFYQQLVLKHLKLSLNLGTQSIQTKVHNRNQTSPLSLFLLNTNRSDNPVESFKNKGMFLLQISFSYVLF